MLTVTRDMILPTDHHRLLPAAAVVRPQPGRPLVQDGARRFAVPRAVSRRGRQRSSPSRRPPGSTSSPTATAASTSRSAASRGSSTRSSGWAASTATATPRAAGWRATACAPARSCGRCRRPISPASSRDKLTRGPLEYAALWQVAQRMTRPAGEVRRDLRAGAGLDAVERALRRRQGDDPRPLRHHERGVARAGRRRLPADPGRGAAAPQPTHPSRTAPTPISSSRPRRSTASSPASTPRSGCTPAGAIPTSSASTGRCRATSARCPICCSSTATCSPSNAPARDGQDLPLFKHIKTDKKIGIGVVNHCNTVVEPAEHVAGADPQGAGIHPQGAAGHHAPIAASAARACRGASRSTSAWRWSRAPTSSAASSACRKRGCARPIRSCGSRRADCVPPGRARIAAQVMPHDRRKEERNSVTTGTQGKLAGSS